VRQLPIRSTISSLPNAPSEDPREDDAQSDVPEQVSHYTLPGENPRPENLAYYAVLFAQTAFPHNEVAGNEFARRNGDVALSLLSPTEVGLPYGLYPRLILIWLITQYRSGGSTVIELPWTFQGFADQLGLPILRWGEGKSGSRLKDQLVRLLHVSVRARTTDKATHHDAGAGFHIASRYSLWWDESDGAKATPHANYIEISAEFARLIDKRYPIDIRLVRAIALPQSAGGRGACLALDLYLWLAQRCYRLQRPLELTWQQLAEQLGADYSRTADLARKLRGVLPGVLALYPLRVDTHSHGLIVHPTATPALPTETG
jgi:hypothetical protein